MRLTPLTNVTDESRTMLINGLVQARTNGKSVIAAPPPTLYRKSFLRERLPRYGVEKLIRFRQARPDDLNLQSPRVRGKRFLGQRPGGVANVVEIG